MRALSLAKEGQVVSCEPNCTLREAVQLMARNDVGSVIVTERGRVVGIFTERDLVQAMAQGASLSDEVRKYMSPHPIVALKDESLESVLHKMLERGVRHIPILDSDGKPLGVISIRDVMRKLIVDCWNI